MSLRAGVIGLGMIGGGIAKHLLEAGIPTVVCDLLPEAVEGLRQRGAEVADSPGTLAAGVDVVGVVVRDRDVEEVMDAVLAKARPGTTVVLHSTVHPKRTRHYGALAADRGLGFLEAPVTGGPAGASQGTLTYIVGGDEALIERCRPVFEPPAGEIIHTGELGTAAAVKLGNNLLGYICFLAGFEANLLMQEAGVSLEAFDAVGRSGGQNLSPAISRFLALHRGPDPKDPGYQQMARGITEIAQKDLKLALELAEEVGVSLPGAALTRELMPRIYGLLDEKRR